MVSVLSSMAFPALRSLAASPSNRINMAFIGIGNRGFDDFSLFAYYRDIVNVVALCDVEMGGERTVRALKLCDTVSAWHAAKRYTDFRKMFDECGKEIDAVCIATPDFSHFPATMLAMSLGKAVYCEKPMGNCFREIALMTAAAKRHNVVTQMGNQGHSDGNYWQFRELVNQGFIRDVTRVDAWMCSSRRWHKWNGTMTCMPAGGEPVPVNLDWESWQAQRPNRSYDACYLNGEWRSFYEYGTGAMGDWGAHLFDTAWEFLKLGIPSQIDVPEENGRTDAVYPLSSTIVYHFPERGKDFPACELVWRDGLGNYPAPLKNQTASKYKRKAEGSELHMSDGRVLARGSHGSISTLVAGANPNDPELKRTLRDYPHNMSGHFLNFLQAVRGIEKANSDFSVAGPLSQVMALGALAQRLGKGSWIFDRAKLQFVNNARANQFLVGPLPRAGWEQYARL